MPAEKPIRPVRSRMARLFTPPADLVLRQRVIVKFLLHLAIFVSAYQLAFLFRFDFSVPVFYVPVIWETTPVLLLSKALGFYAFGLFQGWWRYVSIRDILPVTAGCMLGSLIFYGAGFALWPPNHIPRSIYILDLGNTLLLVLGFRYMIRAGREAMGRHRRDFTRRVLIVGAGSAGQMIAREISENGSLGMEQVGFIDDDPAKIGARIQGAKVLGGHERIGDL